MAVRNDKPMKRNIILAAIIGTLASYLPFWEWDGDQWVGILGLGVISFIVLVKFEEVSERMTYKELAQQVYPGIETDNLADLYCPADLWLDDADYDPSNCHRSDCEKCWNREIPEGGEKDDI